MHRKLNTTNLFKLVHRKIFIFQLEDILSAEVKSFIYIVLEPNPKKRGPIKLFREQPWMEKKDSTEGLRSKSTVSKVTTSSVGRVSKLTASTASELHSV